MGIPIEYHIILMLLSIITFFIVFILLFVNPDFYKSIGAMILIFLNVPVSWVAGKGFFSFDLYGYDSDGVVVSNIISEYAELGFIFIVIAYISVVMLFYGFYLLYKKPWDETRKVEGNPYVYYYERGKY